MCLSVCAHVHCHFRWPLSFKGTYECSSNSCTLWVYSFHTIKDGFSDSNQASLSVTYCIACMCRYYTSLWEPPLSPTEVSTCMLCWSGDCPSGMFVCASLTKGESYSNLEKYSALNVMHCVHLDLLYIDRN